MGKLLKIISVSILVLLAISNFCLAQVKVQVVTKTIKESIEWSEGNSLGVVGNRADIFCSSHAKNVIELDVEIIARHEEKKTAEADLQKMKWLKEKVGKKYFVRNYIELERDDTKPESDIKVIYHIKVPANCNVNLDNYFGQIIVENMNSRLKINSEFSIITLKNINGNTNINTTFGDVSIQNHSGQLSIESIRSNIDIIKFSGNLKLKSNVAEIQLSEFDKVEEIEIEADKSKVILSTGNYKKYSYLLDLNKTELAKPADMLLEITKNEKNNIKANYQANVEKPLINIKLNIGSLKID